MANNHLLRVEGPGCHSRPPDQDGHHSCLQLVVDMVMNTSTAGRFRMKDTWRNCQLQRLSLGAGDKGCTPQLWTSYTHSNGAFGQMITIGSHRAEEDVFQQNASTHWEDLGGCSVSEQRKLLEIVNTGMFIVGWFPGHQTAGITCQIQTLANCLS